MNQKTLNGEFTLTGKGLHTGLEITARFMPAPDNHGYKFKRVDLEGQPEIDALAENVVATNRGTTRTRRGNRLHRRPMAPALGDFGKSKHTDKPDLLFRGRRRAQDTEPAA